LELSDKLHVLTIRATKRSYCDLNPLLPLLSLLAHQWYDPTLLSISRLHECVAMSRPHNPKSQWVLSFSMVPKKRQLMEAATYWW
jgi:hypothetical protein